VRRADARKIKDLEGAVAQLRKELDEKQRQGTKQMHRVTELRDAAAAEKNARAVAEKKRVAAEKANACATREAEYWMRSYHELLARSQKTAEQQKAKHAETCEEVKRLQRELRQAWRAKGRVDVELRGWHWMYAKLEPHDKKWVREYRKTMPAGFDYDGPQ
jgi:hypothetical protein